MKTKYMFFRSMAVLVMATMALSGCDSDNSQTETGTDYSDLKFVVTAEMPDSDPETRALKAGWEDGDKIVVFFGTSANNVVLEYDETESEWARVTSTITSLATSGTAQALHAGGNDISVNQGGLTGIEGDLLYDDIGDYTYDSGSSTVTLDLAMERGLTSVVKMGSPDGATENLDWRMAGEGLWVQTGSSLAASNFSSTFSFGNVLKGIFAESDASTGVGATPDATFTTATEAVFHVWDKGATSGTAFDVWNTDAPRVIYSRTYPGNLTSGGSVVLDGPSSTIESEEWTESDDTPGTEEGVVIDGVTWATRNVGTSGQFVTNPEDYGTHFTGTQFLEACPDGWRLPTQAEAQHLVASGSTWTTQNSVSGYVFGSGENTIFLPAAGVSDGNEVINQGVDGTYWTSTPSDIADPYWYNLLSLDSSGASATYASSMHINSVYGYSVRCVKEQGTISVTDVSLPPTMTLAIDDTETLTPEIQPWNASNQTVTWESSHPQYATVNPSTGEVTAVSEGSTTITVTTADGGKTASCIVTVSAALGLHLLDNTIDPKSILVEYTASAEQYARLLSSDYGFSADMVEITNTIYEKFEDDFDFIFYVLNEPESEEIIDRLGFYGVNMRVSNAVKGVGLSIGSSAENWGSAGKLKSVMYLPYNTAMSGGPTLHELAHNWAAFVVPTYGPNPDSPTFDEIRYDGHWGISNAGGQLGGFTEARVIEENSGSEQGKTLYQARYLPKEPRPGTIYPYGNFGLNANGGNSLPYSDIELYLMGMKSAEELSAANFTLDVYSGNSIEVEGDYPFGEGYFWSTTKTTYSINDIINYAGPRVPDANASQKEFKVLTVVLTQEGQGEDYYAEIIKDMSWLAGGMEDNTYPGRGIYNFQQATYGVGSLVVDGVKNSLKTEPTTRSATTRAILPSRDLRDRIHIDGLDENLLAPKR